jgi:hypothetical protein
MQAFYKPLRLADSNIMAFPAGGDSGGNVF